MNPTALRWGSIINETGGVKWGGADETIRVALPFVTFTPLVRGLLSHESETFRHETGHLPSSVAAILFMAW
jgi:hypothetical protein